MAEPSVDHRHATTTSTGAISSGHSVATKIKSTPTYTRHSKSKMSFYDLSAELRNRIYTFALVPELPLNIESLESLVASRRNGSNERELQLPLPGTKFVISAQHPQSVYTDDLSRRVCFLPGAATSDISVNLLRASRRTHQEATSLFYGANTFHFNGSFDRLDTKLEDWQKEIGTSVQYVRTIICSGVWSGYLPKFRPLESFTSLVRIEVMGDETKRWEMHEKFMLCLVSLVKHFHPELSDRSWDMLAPSSAQQWEGLMLYPNKHSTNKRSVDQSEKALHKADLEENERSIKEELKRLSKALTDN